MVWSCPRHLQSDSAILTCNFTARNMVSLFSSLRFCLFISTTIPHHFLCFLEQTSVLESGKVILTEMVAVSVCDKTNFTVLLYDQCLLRLPMNCAGILLFYVTDYTRHLIYHNGMARTCISLNGRWTVN